MAGEGHVTRAPRTALGPSPVDRGRGQGNSLGQGMKEEEVEREKVFPPPEGGIGRAVKMLGRSDRPCHSIYRGLAREYIATRVKLFHG